MPSCVPTSFAVPLLATELPLSWPRAPTATAATDPRLACTLPSLAVGHLAFCEPLFGVSVVDPQELLYSIISAPISLFVVACLCVAIIYVASLTRAGYRQLADRYRAQRASVAILDRDHSGCSLWLVRMLAAWNLSSFPPVARSFEPLPVTASRTQGPSLVCLGALALISPAIVFILVLVSISGFALDATNFPRPAPHLVSTLLAVLVATPLIRATLLNPLRFLGRWAIIADPEQIEIPNWIHGARTFRWHDSVLVIVGVFGWTARVAVVERETGRVAAFNMPRENLDELVGVVRASEVIAPHSAPAAVAARAYHNTL